MKKFFVLTMCAMAVVGCGDDAEITTSNTAENTSVEQQTKEPSMKAIMPDEELKGIAFTKKENGIVIFEHVKDLLKDNYTTEDKTLSIQSEKPLKLTISEQSPKNLTTELFKRDIENAFVRTIFNVFAHTNENEVDLTSNIIDVETKKLIKNTPVLKGKVTRDFALKVLTTFSSATSFDELVSLDPNAEYQYFGLSASQKMLDITSDRVRSLVVKALTTGKIETPMEQVIVPLGFDMYDIKLKLKEFGINPSILPNKLTNGQIAHRMNINEIIFVEGVGESSSNVDYLSVMFGMSNNPDINTLNTFVIGLSCQIVPNSEKAFNEIEKLIRQASKQLKKKDVAETKAVVDDITIELKVMKNLGGLSTLTFKKLEMQPMKFN